MAKSQKLYKSDANELVAELTREKGVLPPQALELEQAILGALMIEKDAIFSIQDILRSESFYKDAHATIFHTILELSEKLEPIDVYTVGEMLNRKGLLSSVGGATYLAMLTQKVGSAAHVEFHAKIVAQKFIQRELIRATSDIQKNSFDDSIDVTDLIDFAEGEIFKVSEGHIKRDVQKSYDIVKRALKAIEEAALKPDGLSGVPSGFNDLDKLTLGWQPSDLVIIAARPSMGKTAFVLSLARNIVVQYSRGVAFFSLEMSSVQLINRLLVSESGIDSRVLKNGRLSDAEWEKLHKSIVPLQNAPLFVDDTPSLSIFEFRSKARRLKKQHDIELIIIDYLQLMTGPSDTRGNREQEVAAISRSLKAIAKELEIPIIALSQLNRSVETRGGNKRPQLSDLRESGAIEQDADIVSFIHRPDYYGMTHDEDGTPLVPGTAEIIVAKHRNGPTDIVRLKFKKDQALFTNFDDVPEFYTASSQGGADGGFTDFESTSFTSSASQGGPADFEAASEISPF